MLGKRVMGRVEWGSGEKSVLSYIYSRTTSSPRGYRREPPPCMGISRAGVFRRVRRRQPLPMPDTCATILGLRNAAGYRSSAASIVFSGCRCFSLLEVRVERRFLMGER
jgi:hypothetical protein